MCTGKKGWSAGPLRCPAGYQPKRLREIVKSFCFQIIYNIQTHLNLNQI
jgi:hypothetical protein